jgi:protocatechuate 3,4-dioxygenase beta subunit
MPTHSPSETKAAKVSSKPSVKPKPPGVNLKRPKARDARARAFTLRACALALTLLASATAFAQKEAPAAVAGRVSDGERGVAGVVVMLTPDDQPRSGTALRAKTDAEGRYRITNVPPGHYSVMPFAPAYVVEGVRADIFPQGKPLLLAAGDVADDVDFRMERGGVITGRVTDDGGNPVVSMFVAVMMVDNNGAFQAFYRPTMDSRDMMTDDRGVYRIYGLPAGRYRVSAGSDGGNGAINFGGGKVYHRTFYPDATDPAQAQFVEISAGHEAADIDIKLGSPLKTYKASGRFVEAETGRAAPNVPVGYGVVGTAGNGPRVMSYGSGSTTDADGEFTVEGLAPGHYAVFVSSNLPNGAGDSYSDPVTFDVADADVTGLVVKVKHGSTLSGVVAVEGVADPATAARFVSQMQVFAYYDMRATPTTMMGPGTYVRPVPASPDGSFSFTGLRPGKIIVTGSSQAKGLTLSRVELNGADVTRGIDVGEGAQVSGVRVVFKYGSGVISGQVNLINGTLPPDARVIVTARPVESAAGAVGQSAIADARGHFRMDALPAGDYEVSVTAFLTGTGPAFRSDAQRVSVAEGGAAAATLTIDLSAPLRRRQP